MVPSNFCVQVLFTGFYLLIQKHLMSPNYMRDIVLEI